MPKHVVEGLARALDEQSNLPLGSARVLLIGLSYKKNISDVRESPSLRLIELMEARGATVDYHDPHVEAVPATRQHPRLAGRRSTALTPESIHSYDAVLISTDHDDVDYESIALFSKLVVDTRNAMGRRGLTKDTIVKA